MKKVFSYLLICALFLSTFYVAPQNTQRVEAETNDEITDTALNSSSTNDNIEIGDYIEFGSYYNEPILWEVININSDGSYMLWSDKLLCLKAFDASGDDVDFNCDGILDTNDSKIRDFGSNYWVTSNIREWLNSEDTSVIYSHNEPTQDRVFDNAYNNEAGFLSNFTYEENNLISPYTHKVILSYANQSAKDGGTIGLYPESSTSNIFPSYLTYYDTAYYKMVTDKVFILDFKELYEYVSKRGFSIIKSSTLEAANHSTYSITGGEPWKYFTLTSDASNGCHLRTITQYGGFSLEQANSGWAGIVPAINIKSNIMIVSGEGSITNPYDIKQNTQNTVGNITITSPIVASTVTSSPVHLAWNAVSGTNEYRLYFNNGATPEQIINSATTSYDFSYPTGAYTFRVEAYNDIGQKIAEGNVSFSVSLKKSIIVTVTDSNTNEGIYGASITLGTQSATSGLDGTYEFKDIANGTYNISCSLAGFLTHNGSVTVNNENVNYPIALVRDGSTYSITGTVLDADDSTPIQGATVMTGSVSASTGANGQFTLTGLARGSYTIDISKDGYVSKTGIYQFIDSSNVSVGDILLSKATNTINFTGTVYRKYTDYQQTVPYATVVLNGSDDPRWRTKTNADGNFSFEGVAPGSSISVLADGYENGIGTVQLDSDQHPVIIEMPYVEGLYTVTGQVISKYTRQGIPGATVELVEDNTFLHYIETTDPDGFYQFKGVGSGITGITFAKSGYVDNDGNTAAYQAITGLYSNIAELNATLIDMNGYYLISGVIKNKQNEVVPNAIVKIQGYDTFSDYTDSNGVYKIYGVSSSISPWTLSATKDGFTATSEVTVTTADVTNANLTLSSGNDVSDVTLNKTELTFTDTTQQQLTATVSPSTALNKNVTWSSSDTSVATVSSTGLVTPIKSGTATITVTTADGGFKKTCNVTIGSEELWITSSSLSIGTAGTQYSCSLNAIGGIKPYTWSTVGLPDGLSIESTTGLINGITNAVGTYKVIIKLSDSIHQTQKILNLSIGAPGKSSDATLSSLSVSSGSLSPSFSPNVTNYTVNVTNNVVILNLRFFPVPKSSEAGVTVNGYSTDTEIFVVGGSKEVAIEVTAPDGITKKKYNINVIKEGTYFSETAYITSEISGIWKVNSDGYPPDYGTQEGSDNHTIYYDKILYISSSDIKKIAENQDIMACIMEFLPTQEEIIEGKLLTEAMKNAIINALQKKMITKAASGWMIIPWIEIIDTCNDFENLYQMLKTYNNLQDPVEKNAGLKISHYFSMYKLGTYDAERYKIGIKTEDWYDNKIYFPSSHIGTFEQITDLDKLENLYKYEFSCPVTIEIYDNSNNLVATISDTSPSAQYSDFAYLYLTEVNGDYKKTVYLFDPSYQIKIVGTGIGTMDYSVHEANADGSTKQITNFISVPITKSTVITTTSAASGTLVLSVDADGDGTAESTINPTSTVKFTTYTVTFKDWNGTVLKTETVNDGAAATAPSNPSRTGYSFTGWDVSFINVTSDLIVTAQYSNIGNMSGGSNSSDVNNTPLPKIKDSKTVGWTSIIMCLKEYKAGSIVIDMNGSTIIKQDVFEVIKGKDIKITFVLGNGIEWFVNGKDISENAKLQDIDFNISINEGNIPAELVDDFSETKKIQFSLAHDGSFGFTATLRLPLNEGKCGQKAYLFYYNPVTKQLELQSSSLIDENGNVEFEFTHASDYVILIPDDSILKDEIKNITVTPTNKILYCGGTKGKSITIKTLLPKSLQQAVSSGIYEMSISYLSSKPSVAYVSKTGKIIAKKEGKTIITTIVTVNGIERKLKTTIKVKKAYIKMTMSTNSMKIGENYIFKAKGYGVNLNDIIYLTSKKSIVVISKTTGKAIAVSKGTDYVIAKVGDIEVKTKVIVK